MIAQLFMYKYMFCIDVLIPRLTAGVNCVHGGGTVVGYWGVRCGCEVVSNGLHDSGVRKEGPPWLNAA